MTWIVCLIAVQHVFNDHAGVIDLDDFIFSLHDVTLPGDENFTFVIKEDSLRSLRLAGKAVKLEWIGGGGGVGVGVGGSSGPYGFL